ncbi:UNKNOWN [Stylonychia lemnae]|uniref:Uncharacterized protein n=1 Tax=Stylonychia lemnae TaxID=5949 RepID=A0A078BA61_STYLE|nr:UNKNOWN [Stylonychia lemnae]|eukprot:CDW90408.1 UNKNOWN [Stylonychia lemnae]
MKELQSLLVNFFKKQMSSQFKTKLNFFRKSFASNKNHSKNEGQGNNHYQTMLLNPPDK